MNNDYSELIKSIRETPKLLRRREIRCEPVSAAEIERIKAFQLAHAENPETLRILGGPIKDRVQ